MLVKIGKDSRLVDVDKIFSIAKCKYFGDYYIKISSDDKSKKLTAECGMNYLFDSEEQRDEMFDKLVSLKGGVVEL